MQKALLTDSRTNDGPVPGHYGSCTPDPSLSVTASRLLDKAENHQQPTNTRNFHGKVHGLLWVAYSALFCVR